MAAICWTLSEDFAGMEAQTGGLAEALGYVPTIKRVKPRAPWKYLPNALWFNALAAPGPGGDRLDPPWPQVLVSCGRKAVPLALAIRAAGGTRCIHIQDPHTNPGRFDMVVVPRHDGLSGDNVIVTRGAVHPVTPAKLAAAARVFAPRLAHLKRPLVAVLVGGPTNRYSMTPDVTEILGSHLAAMAASSGASLLVTASRRTGADNLAALRRGLAGTTADIWDGTGDNPYLGYLALADAVVVTADSVSMTSEACSTLKPVYVYDLPGGSRRFQQFHESLRQDGVTRRFVGTLEFWSYPALDDTAKAAAEIRRRLTLPD